MTYVSEAARKRPQQREQWMTLAEAVADVRSHDGCSHAKARKQLSEVLADGHIPVKWQDEDVQRAHAPESATKEKLGPEDKGKLAEFRAKCEPQKAALQAKGYMDHGIKAIIEFAYRKKTTVDLAKAVFDIGHPPPPLAGSARFEPRPIDWPRILLVPAFWRDTRYRGGKVLDPTCDRWRVPLLERASVRRWLLTDETDGRPTPGHQASDRHGTNVIALSEAREERSRGGRPSAKDEIHAMLDKLSREGRPVRTMSRSELAKKVATGCGKTLGDKRWDERTVLQHIQHWLSDHPN